MYFHSQTRYQRTSIGYIHNFGIQHSNGTYADTVQPNRKWIIEYVCLLNLQMQIRSQTRYMWNFNGYSHCTYVVGPAIHWNLWCKNPRWRPLNFKYMYLRSQDKTSTTFQRLHPRFVGSRIPAGLVPILYNQTENGYSKITTLSISTSNACISIRSRTRYQRNWNVYIHVFEVQHCFGTYENIMLPNWKGQNSRWQPLKFNRMYFRYLTRCQRNSNCYYRYKMCLHVHQSLNVYLISVSRQSSEPIAKCND